MGAFCNGIPGAIVFDGKEVNFTHPLEAMGAGISVRSSGTQSGVPNATVTENIFLRREKRNAFGLRNADWRAMTSAAAQVFKRVWDRHDDPNALAGSLSVGMQQLVEVAKAISIDSKLLIMDEPTSCSSPEKEIDELFKVSQRPSP